MENAKYKPEEIERIIDEEISRIDAVNSAGAGQRLCGNGKRRSPLSRIAAILRPSVKQPK